MMTLRRAENRGHFDHGWLNTYHSFSFADYYDPAHMGFRQLRVINEDRVQPGRGFGTHAHQDMEIISYVLEGALEHKDDIGNGSVIRPGEVQRMSAGTSVTHSEYNHSKSEVVHFLQMWILPERRGLAPGYEQKYFADEEKCGRWCLIGARDGREGAVTIHQDVELYAAIIGADQRLTYQIGSRRYAWAQVTRGAVLLNGESLQAGDGAALSNERAVTVTAERSSEVLLFDLA